MVNRSRSPQLPKVAAPASRLRFRLSTGVMKWGFAILCLLIDCSQVRAQWTLLPQNPLGTTGTMLLLNNGTVMVNGVTAGSNPASQLWTKLSPDANGDYAAGTWSQLASMSVGRNTYSSWVLPSGNVVIMGGRYESGFVFFSDVEIFNTATGVWTQSQSSYPGGFFIDNPPSVLLGSGAILVGDIFSASTYLYNPTTDTWSASGQKATNFGSDINEGQSFTLLPNGQVLTWPSWENWLTNVPPSWVPATSYLAGQTIYTNGNFYVCTTSGKSAANGIGPSGAGNAIVDFTTVWSYLSLWNPNTKYNLNQSVYVNAGVFTCTTAGTSAAAVGPSGVGAGITDGSVVWNGQGTFDVPAGQLYSPNKGTWALTAAAPVILNNSPTIVGPAAVMPDQTVIQFGDNGNTGIYYPATANTKDRWIAGPTLPAGTGADYAPGAMLPNGNFLIAVDAAPGHGAPTQLYTYSYLNQSLTPLAIPPLLNNDLQFVGALNLRMLVLPNGHVLLNTGTGNIWDYNPGGAAPLASWRPTVATVTKNTSTVYTLTGTRLTGISAGACYGANAQSATNYPIVRLTNTTTGQVRYATSTGWPIGISTPSSAAQQTIQFQLPSGFGVGTYNLVVIANGIASAPFSFTVPPSHENYVTLGYNSNTQIVTLTGDNENNSVSMVLKNQVLTVTGAGPVGGNGPTIIRASQTGTWAANSTAVTLNGPNSLVSVGMLVYGTGIPNGTTVSALSGTSLTLSQKSTAKSDPPTTQLATWAANSTAVTLTAANPLIVVGMSVSGQGIPPDTTVAAVTGAAVTLSQKSSAPGTGAFLTFDGATLSFEQVNATQSGTWATGTTVVTLSAPNSQIVPGMAVAGPGIPIGTTVAVISGTTLTMSNPASAAGSGVTLSFGGLSQQIHFGTNLKLETALTIIGSFFDGDDYLAMSGIAAKNVTLTMGNGNDSVTATYANIFTLSIDGGTGYNTFGYSASKITNFGYFINVIILSQFF